MTGRASDFRPNLDTIVRAARNGDLAVAECRRRSDGAIVHLLVAVGRDGEERVLSPFAEMIDGNPYELYDPPAPEDDPEEGGR